MRHADGSKTGRSAALPTAGEVRAVAAVLVAVALLGGGGGVAAQGHRLTDVEPYLMDRTAEIALARSAAPWGLGGEASVWVLTREGYVEAEPGTNGFACFVGRGWSGPIVVGPPSAPRLHPDVFDPALRAPHCFNPKAAQSILPWQLARTDALLAGVSAEEVGAVMERRLRSGALRLPERGAMAYMMSPGQDLGPAFGPWRPHVMIYIPYLSNADWGIPGFTHDYPFVAESGGPWSVAVTPMAVYSDGTRAAEVVEGRPSEGGGH